MGSGGSVNKKPQSPYHRQYEAKLRRAKSMRHTDRQASDFYNHCEKGETDQVRQILEASDRQSIDELVKLEPNGNTALHVATEKGHTEIVKLLLEYRCPRIILNRAGKRASEEAVKPAMQKLFLRCDTSDRFHDSDTTKTMAHYLPKQTGTGATSNVPLSLEFFTTFETEDDVRKYSLDHQTTAMWVKLFNWLLRTFPSLFQREYLSADAFHLHENTDFKDFLKKKLGAKYEETLKEFNKAHQENSIIRLLTLYTSEDIGFYKSLNKQLADSPHMADNSPHLCDRFIIEFHIREDELATRSFIGTTYRGATINKDELSLYETVLENKPRGVIVFKAFTSTSEEKDVALKFIPTKPRESDKISVLFIIQIKDKSPTIVGIADVSDFEKEKEILVMPGNLFVVKKVVKDVVHYTKEQVAITLTEIHLEYLHIPVSFWKKLSHTYRSAYDSVTSTNADQNDNN
jgi:ankyrin repeat protein